jgi:hypothetical protein
MFVIPECFYRGSSFFRQLESGFRLKACRNDNYLDFCKRLKLSYLETGHGSALIVPAVLYVVPVRELFVPEAQLFLPAMELSALVPEFSMPVVEQS